MNFFFFSFQKTCEQPVAWNVLNMLVPNCAVISHQNHWGRHCTFRRPRRNFSWDIFLRIRVFASRGTYRRKMGAGGLVGPPHHSWARPHLGPRPTRVWWPHLAPGAHPSPISSPRRVNPNTKKNIPRKVPSRPSSSISDRGSSDVLPAPCRRGNHHRGLLHHHACLRSDA